MWIPKWQRDQKKGVDFPFPTEVLSNEEFIALQVLCAHAGSLRAEARTSLWLAIVRRPMYP